MEPPKEETVQFDVVTPVQQPTQLKKPVQKVIKKKLGGNKIETPVDFDSLVTDDLKLKEVQKPAEIKLVKTMVKTKTEEEPK